MKTALIIPIFNRPEYVAQCFDSLKKADLKDTSVILIDDGSTDKRTKQLIAEFNINGVPILKYEQANAGVKEALLFGFRLARQYFNPEYYINLDSDAIVKPDFIQKLVDLKKRFPENIVSGFNSMTKNRDGSERHIVIKDEEDHCFKKSIGGINMVFNEAQITSVYTKLQLAGNWDHELSKEMEADGFPMICLKPSVVQHIGARSSMGHNHDKPDIAEDFDYKPKLQLPNVALFILDTINPQGLINAVKKSTEEIEFGQIICLTSEASAEKVSEEINEIRTGKTLTVVESIFGIDSKEEYSRFMIRDLYSRFDDEDFFNTSDISHVLIIQADGYILNPSAWTDEFLQFDYIGAKWFYNDKYNVGNGGFSLRSIKLINMLATDEHITKTHPEDDAICRTYGDYLTKRGIKFAPEAIADKFSFESYGKKSNVYSGSFGFHGYGIDFRRFPKLAPNKTQINSNQRPRSYGERLSTPKR